MTPDELMGDVWATNEQTEQAIAAERERLAREQVRPLRVEGRTTEWRASKAELLESHRTPPAAMSGAGRAFERLTELERTVRAALPVMHEAAVTLEDLGEPGERAEQLHAAHAALCARLREIAP